MKGTLKHLDFTLGTIGALGGFVRWTERSGLHASCSLFRGVEEDGHKRPAVGLAAVIPAKEGWTKIQDHGAQEGGRLET